MQPQGIQFNTTIGNKPIKFETGRLAGQAGGAVTLQLGDTMVLAAATMSSQTRPGIDFLPLTVDYEERMYAGGRIPGSFFRREGRPSEGAILTARLTDRPIRPLFNKEMRNDVQIILYSLSTDGENPIDIMAINAASTALTIASELPTSNTISISSKEMSCLPSSASITFLVPASGSRMMNGRLMRSDGSISCLESHGLLMGAMRIT